MTESEGAGASYNSNTTMNVAVTKSMIEHGAFRECIWSNIGFDDVAERKKLLCRAVWEDCGFANRGLYLNILFFLQYFSGFCTPRLARYKKVYKADIPAVVGGAELRSGEVEIASNDAEIVFAVNVVSPCTFEKFLAAAALLHESRNRHLVSVGNSSEFIPERCWGNIYADTGAIGCCLDDRCVADILDVLPDGAHMLWTGGFFDDADICVSLLARAGGGS